MTIQIENIPSEKAIDALQSYSTYKETINCRYSNLCNALSNYDRQQQDILHAIECLSLPASTTSKMCKELKRIRKLRREVKEELEVISVIHTTLTSCKPNVNVDKTYTTKTKILDKYLK